jgi:hypothetical protein
LALAVVFVIACDSFEPLDCRSLSVVLLLIANVVYHPLEIFCPKTHDAVARLPLQQLAIDKLLIDLMRTGAFEFSNPLANQQRGRDGNRDVHVSFSAADFVKDQALCPKRVTPNITMESWLYYLGDDRQALFYMPGEVKIDF